MIIGISGKMGSGKDTTAKFIQEILPTYNIVHFADILKEVCSSLFGISKFYFYGDKNYKVPNYDFTVREIMQKVGTFVRQEFGEDFWIKRLFQEYKNEYIIIADVRFLNEANKIKELGGQLLRIERDDVTQCNHISETELDDYDKFDAIIYNNGSIKDLEVEIMNWLNG